MFFFKAKKKPFREREKNSADFLVVGLGNPGEKYAKTIHNAGFRVVSMLREKESLPQFQKDRYLCSLFTTGKIGEKSVVLLLPLTFMNRSGEAVKAAQKRFPGASLLVVHDDMDLSFGVLRLSLSGSSAGHKGINSLIRHLKSKNFARLRIGMRQGKGKAENFILKKLPPGSGGVEKEAAEKLSAMIKEERLEQRTIRL